MYFAVVQLCMSSESVVTFPMHEKEKHMYLINFNNSWPSGLNALVHEIFLGYDLNVFLEYDLGKS